MLTAAPRKRMNKRSATQREHLRQRSSDVLKQEIGFVSNSKFRDYDRTGTWRKTLRSLDASAIGTNSQPLKQKYSPHLASLCSDALLNIEEERDLFRLMNYLKYRANSIRATISERRPNERKLDEFDNLLAAADRLRNRIVTANTRLVVSLAKKFVDDGNSFDDLFSEGVSCLIKAIDKFDLGAR